MITAEIRHFSYSCYILLVAGDSADPVTNPALVQAISRAKSNGVPKANIQAALDQVRVKYLLDLLLLYQKITSGRLSLRRLRKTKGLEQVYTYTRSYLMEKLAC